jgi:hypothetical protein
MIFPVVLAQLNSEIDQNPFQIWFITWYGEFDLINGRLQDLTTIFRNGDVNMDYQDNVLLLDAGLGFKDLQVSMRWN